MTMRWRKRKSITFVNEDRIKVTRENVSRQLLLLRFPRSITEAGGEGEEREREREHVQCVMYNSWRILEGLILNAETKKDFDRTRPIYRVTANSIRIHSRLFI